MSAPYLRIGDVKYPRESILAYVYAHVDFFWQCTDIAFHPCQSIQAHVIPASIPVGSLLIGPIPVHAGMLFFQYPPNTGLN